MPRLTNTNIPSLGDLLDRYQCTRGTLSRWLDVALANDKHGNPVSVLHLLEQVGYKKKQSYFTPKQWEIATTYLDPVFNYEPPTPTRHH